MRNICRSPLTLAVALVAGGLFASPAFAASTAYRNAVLADGATAYFEFEETTGTTAADTASTPGGANTGQVLGGVTLNQASGFANLGRAYAFNGTDARVQVADNAIFDTGTGAATFELWYRAANNVTRGDLLTYKGTGGDFGIHSQSQGNDTVSAYLNGFIGTATAVPVNNWHHLVLTRGAANDWTIYVDGVNKGTGTNAGTLNIAQDILIGSNFGTFPAPAIAFNGLIDEVALYNVSLSAAQVTNHYNQAVPEPATAGLLALSAAGLLGRRRRRGA